MADEFPLTQQEFEDIYSRVPRLNVEILLKSEKGVYLTKRDIEPCKGQWHLPGGTVYFGESLLETVKRIANRELGIQVATAQQIGYIEYPSHYKKRIDHPFGMVFAVTDYAGSVAINQESQEAGWFTKMPKPMHADQDTFLIDHELL